jgi:hypothetical protein
LQSASGLGMGASRVEERVMSAMGISNEAPVAFESCEALPFGGVMLLLPFLLECGLMSYINHYRRRLTGYYSFNNLVIIIAFIYLCRIKSFERIKHYSPGEFGKLVGYDRIPEVKTLRGMVREITSQKCAGQWAAALSQSWIEEENPQLYYIDGHVQIYHGYLANLGKKHVSRQRLCLPGVMEFWVNASDGSPYFYVTADVNEKMNEILGDEIIPQLLKLHPVTDERRRLMEEDPDEPVFTLVFDREAYSPEFFFRLWNKYRIAVITYRKNVKDTWDESLFEDYAVSTTFGSETMKLHEQEFYPLKNGNNLLREVRRLCREGHQTSIVTTNRKLLLDVIASCMFARWSQEIFFRYMRQEYALDKIIQYSVDELDNDIRVVNVEYNNISYRIKKEREKLSRRKAKLYEPEQENPLQEDDEKENKKWMKNRLEVMEEVQQMEQQIENLINQRKNIPYKIPISQMPESIRYNQLNRESKMIQNIIKMICYRAETAFANLLSPHYKRAKHEIRALIKSIIHTPINMEVDRENGELNITLFPLSNQRSNEAVSKICETINDTNTLYPSTNLRLIFKIATISFSPSQDS